jgi:hypothetical protein
MSELLDELRMKYFVFKLSSEFSYDKLIESLQANREFTQRGFIDGTTLAKILVKHEWKTMESGL